ncbi:AAA family ATPase [Candidatus Poribacteria bacterium]|nr:AAA family ATPase [Candidatus Poribacteria bacterium]
MKDSTFITRVVLKNYKSIAACDVRLGPLTFLVGRNGSGKSNFLDALRFVADALNTSLDHAIRARGGINDVLRRSRGHPNHFSIRLEFSLLGGVTGHYAFQIRKRSPGGYEVRTEECSVQNERGQTPEEYFRIDNGVVIDASMKVAPAAATDRLYLVNASGLPEFRPVYDAFSRMGFYNLNPDKIRDLQDPHSGDMLLRDGSNLTSVLAQLSPIAKQDIEEYLELVAPDLREVDVKTFGSKLALAFRQKVTGDRYQGRFYANNMSDGTLRALGILVALFQGNQAVERPVTLVGIEEPEIALHPGSVVLLLVVIRDAAQRSQVIVTSHSPDLLEDKHLDVDSILAVEAGDGNTVIAPVDEVSRSVVRDKLFTIGELLRSNQLQPDPAALSTAKEKQQSLPDFDELKSGKAKSRGKHE